MTDRALAFVYATRYDEAIGELERIRQQNPEFERTYLNLAFAYEHKGNFSEALAALERLFSRQFENGKITAERLSALRNNIKTSLEASKKSGARGYWEAKIAFESLDKGNGGTQTSPLGLARVYAALDEKDKAFEYLERSLELRETGFLLVKAWPAF